MKMQNFCMIKDKNVECLVNTVLFLLLLLLGFLTGGHVMRLCHGHDESLTIPGAEKNEEEQRLADNY